MHVQVRKRTATVGTTLQERFWTTKVRICLCETFVCMVLACKLTQQNWSEGLLWHRMCLIYLIINKTQVQIEKKRQIWRRIFTRISIWWALLKVRGSRWKWSSLILDFYRAMLCICGTSNVPVSICPSVCMSVCSSVRLSVTSRSSTKTAKRRITQTTPHDSPGTLVFWCQRSPRNSTGVTPTGAPNAGGVGQNRRLSANNRLYLENGTR